MRMSVYVQLCMPVCVCVMCVCYVCVLCVCVMYVCVCVMRIYAQGSLMFFMCVLCIRMYGPICMYV